MAKQLKKMEPLPLSDVKVGGGFWKKRIDTNRKRTIPHEQKLCKETGRIDAFRAVWDRKVKLEPHHFWDSDLAKLIEAVGYSLATNPDPALERDMDKIVDWIGKAQQRDGYLNTHYTVVEPKKRWSNLRDMHELYCAGHLMESAVAYYEGTGKRELLDVLSRYADYIGKTFGSKDGQKRGYPGHQEIELALVKLYRATGEKKYLKLAKFFVDERGKKPHYFDIEAKARREKRRPGQKPPNHDYTQAHVPVRRQKTAEGHSVRAVYLYSGMADVAAETGDAGLLAACRRLWDNITTKRMYVTGGIGSTNRGERFTYDFDLPNGTAYAETCAAIGLVFFATRMLQIEADAKYADVMELALYNGVTSGVSLDGKKFFYDNLLTALPDKHRFSGQKSPERQEWFGCACCPPNIARLLASMGHYAYSKSRDSLWVHLYAEGEARARLGGQDVRVTQKTEYPWGEKVRLSVEMSAPSKFTLALRIPGWCGAPRLKVAGKNVKLAGSTKKGYAYIKREWSPGDVVELTLPMPVERIEAHPKVAADAGCVALKRGPVVYCLEEVDNGPDLADVALPRKAKLTARFDKKLLGGVTVITGKAMRRSTSGWKNDLYRPTGASKPKLFTMRAVPYAVWSNRRPGEMRVWIREQL